MLFCLFWCWDPPFKVEAGVQYSWGVQNVQGIFKLPEQHLKSAPIQEVTWPDSEAYRPDATKSNPLPHVLPMFQHAPVPLANAQLFRPVAGHQQLPNSLVGLLLPSRQIPHASEQTPDQLPYPISASKVEVSCGSSMISVRVNRGQLGFDAHSSTFRLGTCPVRLETPEYFYFTYFHSECGSVSTVKFMAQSFLQSCALHVTECLTLCHSLPRSSMENWCFPIQSTTPLSHRELYCEPCHCLFLFTANTTGILL